MLAPLKAYHRPRLLVCVNSYERSTEAAELSSQVSTWRRQSERGDFDPATLRKRVQIKNESKAAERRIAELERENRGLRRRVERAELIGEMQ